MTSPTASETAQLNLEYYRKQAKALLRAARAGDRNANDRLRRHGDDHDTPVLHMAQRTIAREQGFPSWPRFSAFIIESRLDFNGLVARFLAAATSDLRQARDLLADHPEIAGAGFYVALVLGDRETVVAAIDADPGLLRRKSGPENVEPLVYVCFSRFGHPHSERAAQLALTLRLLLERGADPDTAFQEDHGALSCLYAVSGVLGNVEMTRLLLEAGADPNDGESLYHACEQPDLSCLKLLLDHGGDANTVNVLKHMLDRESPEGTRMLLAAGADPNQVNPQGDTALHWAVRRDRSVDIVAQLLDAGANIDAVRGDGRTAYAMAIVSGQAEVAHLLKTRGADTRLNPLDAVIAGQDVAVAPESARAPENARLLTQLAESGHYQAVAALLRAGVPVDSPGDGGITALHYACWRGDVAMIKLLIDAGAPLDIRDKMYGGTPSGFLHHGSTNCGLGDYAEGARLLMAAGIADWDAPSGNTALDAVLREAGLIL